MIYLNLVISSLLFMIPQPYLTPLTISEHLVDVNKWTSVSENMIDCVYCSRRVQCYMVCTGML